MTCWWSLASVWRELSCFLNNLSIIGLCCGTGEAGMLLLDQFAFWTSSLFLFFRPLSFWPLYWTWIFPKPHKVFVRAKISFPVPFPLITACCKQNYWCLELEFPLTTILFYLNPMKRHVFAPQTLAIYVFVVQVAIGFSAITSWVDQDLNYIVQITVINIIIIIVIIIIIIIIVIDHIINELHQSIPEMVL